MAINKTHFNEKVIREIIIEIIKKVPLVNSNITPVINVNLNKMVFNVEVSVNDDNYGVFNCLSEVQDLIYYELSEITDNNEIIVNVRTID
ncbi:MAG: hypothetical protein K2M43_01070 [Mycoplasmoidaceae bacterium]|nr:hypothetical protein [Mycoplasmoidaceae bacterium]